MVRRSRGDRAVVITDARESQDAEFDRRKRRYAIMMALRVVLLIAAASVYRVSVVLAIAFMVGGAVLPWCAVLLANDRPPKEQHRVRRFVAVPTERALPAAPDERVIEG